MLIHRATVSRAALSCGTKYDLIANVTHDMLTAQTITSGLTTDPATRSGGGGKRREDAVPAGSGALAHGSYRVHVVNKVCRDLHCPHRCR